MLQNWNSSLVISVRYGDACAGIGFPHDLREPIEACSVKRLVLAFFDPHRAMLRKAGRISSVA